MTAGNRPSVRASRAPARWPHAPGADADADDHSRSPTERRRYPTTTHPGHPDPQEANARKQKKIKTSTDNAASETETGKISPRANPVTGAPGWQITTRSRRLAVAVAAISGGAAHNHGKGEWQASIPRSLLMVTVVAADDGALWCRLETEPHSGVFAMAFAPWPASTVLKCPLAELPARGQLSVRDVQVTTRMGRTVRYLIPAFTTTT